MMEFLVTNNLNVYFLNVLLMNYFDRLIVNQDKLLKFDINVVQLRIHVQIQAKNRLIKFEKFFLDKFLSVNEI